MLKYVIFYIVLALTTGTRLDFDSDDCKVYLEKFGTTKDVDGAGASKIAFSENVYFIGPSADILRLYYFDDPKFKGLVLQNGKTPETTCLDMNCLSIMLEIFQKELKLLTQEQLHQKMKRKNKDFIETKNSENFIYKGYYAIAYYPIETDKFLFTFYIGFSITINRLTGAPVDSAFQLYDYYDYAHYESFAYICYFPEIRLQWCTDFTCRSFSTPNLHFNDKFVLLFKITRSGLSNYLLSESEVRFIGNGLDKKATIVQFDITIPGQVKLLLDAEIVWRAVTIKVTSVYSKNPANTTRQIEQTTFGFLTGYTFTLSKKQNILRINSKLYNQEKFHLILNFQVIIFKNQLFRGVSKNIQTFEIKSKQ